MEIEGSDGSRTLLKPFSTTLFGRGNGFHPNDVAVSRRHLSFEFNPSTDTQTGPRVSFEVLGKNPVWVYSKSGDGKMTTFNRFQRSELGVGDLFCLSAKDPVWFTVKKVEKEAVKERVTKGGEIEGRVNDELSQTLEISCGVKSNGDFGLDSVDISSVDPVQEFGFLVIGHEFDQFPKQMIRDVKNWDWCLEDPRRDSDEEEEVVAEKRGTRVAQRGKRKKTTGDDDADEEWTAESEDEEVVTTNARKVQRPTYHTRSIDIDKPSKNRNSRKTNAKTSAKREEEEDEEDEQEEHEADEEDETLGGFIVDDETVEEEEDDEDEEEDETEFVEHEDDLED